METVASVLSVVRQEPDLLVRLLLNVRLSVPVRIVVDEMWLGKQPDIQGRADHYGSQQDVERHTLLPTRKGLSMGVPISQMWTVARYVLSKKLSGERRYPLVLMLEPLFRCNLACAGCGKIQYPADILRKNLSPEDCFKAVDECGAPIVSIPGGEPLLHPQIHEIVEGLIAR